MDLLPHIRSRFQENRLWILALVLFLFPTFNASSENKTNHRTNGRVTVDRRKKMEIFFEFLENSGYKSEIPPYPENGAINIKFNIYVTAMSDIHEQDQEFEISVYLRQEWVDDRLAFADVLPNTTYIDIAAKSDIIWLPDPYFERAKEASLHDITTANTLLSIYSDGRVFFSQRITITHWCLVKLNYFPLDYQECEIRVLSYGNRYHEVRFEWIKGEPLLNIYNIHLTQFSIHHVTHGDCTTAFEVAENKTTDPFTCIFAKIFFKRDLGHYFLQVYIPSTLIVILSWLSFWLDADAVPGRISLGLLSVLSISTQMSYTVNGDMPKVSYIRAIDVWMSTCIIFLFAGVIEFALVNSLTRKGDKRKEKKTKSESNHSVESDLNSTPTHRSQLENQNTATNSASSLDSQNCRKQNCLCLTARRIDAASRIIFPSLFVLFCIIYWIAYNQDPVTKYSDS